MTVHEGKEKEDKQGDSREIYEVKMGNNTQISEEEEENLLSVLDGDRQIIWPEWKIGKNAFKTPNEITRKCVKMEYR